MIRNKTSTAERKYYLKHLQNFLYILKILIIHYLQQSPTKDDKIGKNLFKSYGTCVLIGLA